MKRVTKRNGEEQNMDFSKISKRLSEQALDLNIDLKPVVTRVLNGVYDGVQTQHIDTLASETAAFLSTEDPQYDTFAARIAISNLHKQTQQDYQRVVEQLYNNNNGNSPLISKVIYDVMQVPEYRVCIQKMIQYDRDYDFSYFGFKTLCKSYLLRIGDVICERPQHLWMRVALGLYSSVDEKTGSIVVDFPNVAATYDALSRKIFTHASPTLFNCGTPRLQCSSCFLVCMKEDSLEGIYDTVKECAIISKYAGGIGFNVHCIRATGSYIAGTNGTSNGLMPMLRVFNNTARYVDQGGGKRKGAFAAYAEPHHPDMEYFTELRKNHGDEELRCRDLFTALWIPDLFMKRVKEDAQWSLMCPAECPGLYKVYGKEFEELYTRYESEGRAKKTIKARDLWFDILESQIETGTPYMCYKDAANEKSNQKNIGVIQNSNLCTEVMQVCTAEETAVCNLASISLPAFVDVENNTYNHEELIRYTKQIVRNLNRVIDINFYPSEESRRSNRKHRPIGVGVQGLQDVFFMLRYPFDSEEAVQLNRDIFESIYFGACSASMELAKRDGAYETFHGSPASQGKFQFDLWQCPSSPKRDWEPLREEMIKYGLRNSLLLAPMPTATTSQILGNVECFEPITSNMYARSTLAGSFNVVNKYLVNDLKSRGLWDSAMKNEILLKEGSVSNIERIPEDLRALYKTAWEISSKTVLNMAADRAIYIDQSQSLNAHMAEPTLEMLSSYHFYAWEKGLKTGMYYLRTKSKAKAKQVTVETNVMKKSFGAMAYKTQEESQEDAVCFKGCDSCGA